MLSILKMDLRRMFRSKSFSLAIIIFLLFSGYCIFSQAKWQVINGYQISQNLQLESGLVSVVDYYLNTPLQYMYVFMLKNGLIVFGIYMTTFVASDYQSGFIKNSCMMCKKRSLLIWVRLCILVIISTLIVFLSFLLTSGMGYLLINDFSMGNIKDTLMFASIAILFYVAFFSGLTFLYRLCRNKIPSIILSILTPLGITVGLLQPILNEFTKYSLSGIFLSYPMLLTMNDYRIVIFLYLLFIIIYQGLSLWLFNKRDI